MTASHSSSTSNNNPSTGLKAKLMLWVQKQISRLMPPELQHQQLQQEQQQSQAELAQAREDIRRLLDELDDLQVCVETKDRQLRASAEALALANSEAARSRRLAGQLQGSLDNERRFSKQMATNLGAARKNQKRR